jgi:hypothetical protein
MRARPNRLSVIRKEHRGIEKESKEPEQRAIVREVSACDREHAHERSDMGVIEIKSLLERGVKHVKWRYDMLTAY